MSREKFAVRIVVNLEVEADAIPSRESIGMAQACAEVVAGQAMVQNTENNSRILSGTASIKRIKVGKKGGGK